MSSTDSTPAAPTSETARNSPCPCGSGKKFKRCHGVDAAPKLSAAAPMDPARLAAAGGGMPGFDPSQLNEAQRAQMGQIAQAMQRLPRGQLQRLQSIMQRAMAGKDVSREAQEFERLLPPELQDMAKGFMGAGGMAGMPGMMGGAPAAAPELDVEAAKKLVRDAVARGEVSAEEAEKLLAVPADAIAPDADAKKKWWQRK